jgi:phospholipase/carboxylesterase
VNRTVAAATFLFFTFGVGPRAWAWPSAPTLQARPAPGKSVLKPGETVLANGAVAYLPRSAPSGPLPLVILLHGAGGYPQDFLQSMEPAADRRGAILLAPHSLGRTWDLIENLGLDRDPWRGPDLHRLDQSLADLFAHAEVDPTRVVLLGFSDGASYALSLGLANPRLVTAVVALSPGIFVPPDRLDSRQRVFVAHGRSDHVLSFDTTDRTLIPALRDGGVNLAYRPFAGDHEIKPQVLDEALDFALGLQGPTAPPTSSPK